MFCKKSQNMLPDFGFALKEWKLGLQFAIRVIDDLPEAVSVVTEKSLLGIHRSRLLTKTWQLTLGKCTHLCLA